LNYILSDVAAGAFGDVAVAFGDAAGALAKRRIIYVYVK